MGRLTTSKGNMVWYNGEYQGRPMRFEPYEVLSDCNASDIREILRKLADYEDVCSSPDIMEEMRVDATSMAEQLRAYSDASHDGRLFIVPCKVGDTLYDIFEAVLNGDGDVREFVVTDMHIHIDKRGRIWMVVGDYYLAVEDFGKTIFLSQDEAERALHTQREAMAQWND